MQRSSARLGKRQASIPAEALDTLRGRSSFDMAGASSSSAATDGYVGAGFAAGGLNSGAAQGAYHCGAADGGYAADYADSSNSTRYGDGGCGSSQLDSDPAMQGYQTSLQLPRSPMDFGSIGAEAGRLHGISGGRQRKRATTSDAYAAAAAAAAPAAQQGSGRKHNAALAAYLATRLDPQA